MSKLLQIAMMMASLNDLNVSSVSRHKTRIASEWERKTCKSCTFYGDGDYCSMRDRESSKNRFYSLKPTSKACKNWRAKK